MLQKGRAREINTAIQKAIDQGFNAKQILEEGLMHDIKIIGGKFSRNEVFVPEMLISARAMNIGIGILKTIFCRKRCKEERNRSSRNSKGGLARYWKESGKNNDGRKRTRSNRPGDRCAKRVIH